MTFQIVFYLEGTSNLLCIFLENGFLFYTLYYLKNIFLNVMSSFLFYSVAIPFVVTIIAYFISIHFYFYCSNHNSSSASPLNTASEICLALASVDASSHIPKVCRFNYQSGHIPGFNPQLGQV